MKGENQNEKTNKKTSNQKKANLSIISFLILLSIFVSYVPITSSAKATNETISSDETVGLKENELSSSEAYTVEALVSELFDNKEVQRSEYLYNLDESADYVYVELKGGGYAVFLKERMELLEYSAQGKLNYPETKGKKYYGGPSTYLFKENDYFVDTMTNESFSVTKESAQKYASEVREMLYQNCENNTCVDVTAFDYSTIDTKSSRQDVYLCDSSNDAFGNGLSYDRDNLIHISSGTYIPNYRYFLCEPLHGENQSGTCAAIATQLLLSYHNYYSDRRIIADKYLNGSESDANKNPNYCLDPILMNSYTLGTRGYYEDGRDDTNSYFAYIVREIPSGVNFNQLKSGIQDVLNFRNNELNTMQTTIDYNIISGYSTLGIGSVDSSGIIQIIDSGQPVIVGLQKRLGGTNHLAVAYGYCNYSYNGESYLGYITHFGWKKDEINDEVFTNIWVNSSWCVGYVSLEINHTHNYELESTIPFKEYKCTSCGHRSDSGISMTAMNHYVERTVYVPRNGYDYKDIYVTFATSGYKLFQTFGTNDTVMFLFNDEYQQLNYDDDSGEDRNSLFYHYVQANTPYIVRVKFYYSSTAANIKLGITPSMSQYNEFEEIWTRSGTNVYYFSTTPLNETLVLVFEPTEDGIYNFLTGYDNGIHIDMYMYVMRTDSTSSCTYDDDSGGNQQALITMTLTANEKCVIIVAPYNITTTAGSFYVHVSKN